MELEEVGMGDIGLEKGYTQYYLLPQWFLLPSLWKGTRLAIGIKIKRPAHLNIVERLGGF